MEFNSIIFPAPVMTWRPSDFMGDLAFLPRIDLLDQITSSPILTKPDRRITHPQATIPHQGDHENPSQCTSLMDSSFCSDQNRREIASASRVSNQVNSIKIGSRGLLINRLSLDLLKSQHASFRASGSLIDVPKLFSKDSSLRQKECSLILSSIGQSACQEDEYGSQKIKEFQVKTERMSARSENRGSLWLMGTEVFVPAEYPNGKEVFFRQYHRKKAQPIGILSRSFHNTDELVDKFPFEEIPTDKVHTALLFLKACHQNRKAEDAKTLSNQKADSEIPEENRINTTDRSQYLCQRCTRNPLTTSCVDLNAGFVETTPDGNHMALYQGDSPLLCEASNRKPVKGPHFKSTAFEAKRTKFDKTAFQASSNKIPCLFYEPPLGSDSLILYFHANGEDISHAAKVGRHICLFLRVAQSNQINVLAVEYPGYGLYRHALSSEATILADADSIVMYLQRHSQFKFSNILVMGRSLGSGPATYVAARYPVAGLVLLSPFTSIKNVAKEMLGSIASYFVRDRFNNEKLIQSVKCPVLLIHGKEDEIVSPKHSEKLYGKIL